MSKQRTANSEQRTANCELRAASRSMVIRVSVMVMIRDWTVGEFLGDGAR